jgi:hypothetical protein
MFFRSEFQGFTWHRSKPGEIDKQVIAPLENISSFVSAFSGSDKYANVARGTERDICVVASAAAGFLNDHGWIIRLVDVHPPQADAVGNTGAPEALGPAEFRGWDVRCRCSGILVHGDARQIEKIFEPTRHVVRCRIHASGSFSSRRIAAHTLILRPDKEASALAGSRAQRRIPQPKGISDSFRKRVAGRACPQPLIMRPPAGRNRCWNSVQRCREESASDSPGAIASESYSRET